MVNNKISRKKNRRRIRYIQDTQYMINYLETKWNNKIRYSCVSCLQEAYNSEINNYQGYITD